MEEVFKSKQPMRILNGYNRYELLANQLVKTKDEKLKQFFKTNSNFDVIVDNVLVKLAPDITQIIPIEDPMRMRKEDVINELRRYKISVDIYAFSDALSQQLVMARKLLKRNFVTVLDSRGRPVFIDDANLPVPATEQDEKNLKEPVEPDISKFKKVSTKDEFKMNESSAMSVVPSNETEEINKGMAYEDFVEQLVLNKNPKVEKKTKEIEEFLIKKEEENAQQIVELTREKLVDNATIVPQNFAYLIDYPIFMKKKFFTEEQKESFKILNLRPINNDVFLVFIRYYKIDVLITDDAQKNRYVMMNAVKEFIEEQSIEKQKCCVELNVLQARYDEICAFEPDYAKTSLSRLKACITTLGKRYNAKTWSPKEYTHPGVYRNFTMKMFALVKLGLAIPPDYDGLDKLLMHMKKFKFFINTKEYKDHLEEEEYGENLQ
jgi:transcriptional regulator CtsR